MPPFQIRSQALRRANLPVAPVALPGEGMMTEPKTVSGGRKAWRQSDITRAIKAAEDAGLQSYRIEIAPDGTITIVVGAIAEPLLSCGALFPGD